MLNSIDALTIVNREFPGYQITKQISYNNFFIFIISSPDLDEYPSFVKVDQVTGAFTDFAPWNEPDPVGLEEALLGSEVPDG